MRNRSCVDGSGDESVALCGEFAHGLELTVSAYVLRDGCVDGKGAYADLCLRPAGILAQMIQVQQPLVISYSCSVKKEI